MNDKKIYVYHANVCKALGNPIRIEIIEILSESEQSFGALMLQLNIPKSNLSQHLSVMISNGLIVQRKKGVNSFYRLSSEKVAIACRLMREVLVENLNNKISLFINEEQ